MTKTWNVTVFIDEDEAGACAHARLTGGNPLGHLVGKGSCRATPTAVQDAGQRAVVRALEDLTDQLDHYVRPSGTDCLAGPAAASARIRWQQSHPVPPGLLSGVFHTTGRSA